MSTSSIASAEPARTIIRDAQPSDLAAITAIYGHAVEHGTGTFETSAPSLDEMQARLTDIQQRGWPWLVATQGDKVLGYAYANTFRPRLAYRFCLEDSIYLHPDAQGQGLGTLLLVELMARCEALGARQMLAVIGDSQNHGSIQLHRKLGFTHQGVLQSAGWKFGRWLDVVMMQRSLGQGDRNAPEPAGD